METIIIDTDPGVDDALAIAFATFSQLDIAGITTIFGNTSIEDTTHNALTILQLLGKTLPVYRGASKPLYGQGKKARSHGDNGLGGFTLKQLKRTAEKKNAIEFLVEKLQSSKRRSVTIICIGPVTNLALLNTIRPDLCRRLKKIVILGGVFFEKGNITSYAEFNAYNDPVALSNIFDIGCEKIVIPINICRKIIFTKDDFNRIKNKNLKNSFKKISSIYINYYTSNPSFGTFRGGVMYDLLAVAYLLDSSLFKTRNSTVRVVIDSFKRGKTISLKDKSKNCSVITDVDAQKVKKLFFNTINSYKQS